MIENGRLYNSFKGFPNSKGNIDWPIIGSFDPVTSFMYWQDWTTSWPNAMTLASIDF